LPIAMTIQDLDKIRMEQYVQDVLRRGTVIHTMRDGEKIRGALVATPLHCLRSMPPNKPGPKEGARPASGHKKPDLDTQEGSHV
jgi:hypothetical protein